MPEHEADTHKKKEKVDQSRPGSVLNHQPSSQNLMARDKSTSLIGETPFHPSMQNHAEMLSRATSEQQLIIARQLQRAYGNRYVQRLITSMTTRAKLTVNPQYDVNEQEIARVTAAVTKAPEPAFQKQDAEEDEDKLQTQVLTQIQRETLKEEEQIETKSLIQREALRGEEGVQTKHVMQHEGPRVKEVQTKLIIQRQFQPSEQYKSGAGGEYHGVGGMLHAYVYEPLQEDYSRWMNWGQSLSSSWGEKVPYLGHAGGSIVGFIPWLLGGAGKIIVGVPQFLTPKTQEEHFMTVMTMGTYAPAARFGSGVKYGWWWIKSLFKKSPAIEKKIAEQSPKLVKEVIEQAETKAPGVIKSVAAKEASKVATAVRSQALKELSLAQKRGRVIVNIGGKGEYEGAINLNSNISSVEITPEWPNWVNGSGEDIGQLFPANSIDEVFSSKLPSDVNWTQIADGIKTVLKPGGKVTLNQLGSPEPIRMALEKAKFKNVNVIMDTIVEAIK